MDSDSKYNSTRNKKIERPEMHITKVKLARSFLDWLSISSYCERIVPAKYGIIGLDNTLQDENIHGIKFSDLAQICQIYGTSN